MDSRFSKAVGISPRTVIAPGVSLPSPKKRATPMSLVDKFLSVKQQEGWASASRKTIEFIILRKAPKFRFIFPLFNLEKPLDSSARRFLEDSIFKMLREDQAIKNILFAGVEVYTWHYYKLFDGINLYTIDFNKSNAVFGTKKLHTVGSVTHLQDYYKPGQFDVVIYNGIIGHGLNAEGDVDLALKQAHVVLASGGKLIIGWNNDSRLIDFRLEQLSGYKMFNTYVPKSLCIDSHRIEVDSSSNHTFDFLSKP
jgi:hypothetical protein